MQIILVDAARTLWVWLPTITTIAKVTAAVISLAVAIHKAARYWRTGR
ncbi:hypothetical protein ACQPYE_17750 [Actinosynnema sp. CA-299493]